MEVWDCGRPGNTSAQCRASPRFVPGTWCCLCSDVCSWGPAGNLGVHLGASSAPASSQMQFFPLNPMMWFTDIALVKSEGFLFVRFQQAAPHSSLFGYSKGKVCSWKEKCPGKSRRGWMVRCPGGMIQLGLLLCCLADVLRRLLLMLWVTEAVC